MKTNERVEFSFLLTIKYKETRKMIYPCLHKTKVLANIDIQEQYLIDNVEKQSVFYSCLVCVS